MSRLFRILIALILVLTAAELNAQAPSGSGPQSQGRVTDAARAAELVKYALERFEQGQAVGAQPATSKQAAPERPVAKLSADDAVKRALDNNIELSVQRMNPELQDRLWRLSDRPTRQT